MNKAPMNKTASNSFSFTLEPVPPFKLEWSAWLLRRRPANTIDRWDGSSLCRAFVVDGQVVEVAVSQTGATDTPRLQVRVTGSKASSVLKSKVTSALERHLGLRVDLAPFYRLMAADHRFGALAARFRGLKPCRFPTVFETLVNAISCQQLSLTYGISVLNRLTEELGSPIRLPAGIVHAFPEPADVLRVSIPELRGLGFSRQKAEALTALAQRLIESPRLLEDLDSRPNQEALTQLLQLRGIGRWSAEYALLRGLGRLNVYPGDDVGARNNLVRWLKLRHPLDYEGVHEILGPCQPYAGLMYFHLLLDGLQTRGHLSA